MQFFKPIPITDAILEDSSDNATYYTNVVEPDTSVALWAAGTTYAAGAKVYYTSADAKRAMFVSLVGSNTGNNPFTSWGYWEEIDITESGLSAWAAGTTYALGNQCYVITTEASPKTIHRIFESVVAGNVGHHPLSKETGYWIEVGATNRWRMFDQSSGSYTEYLDDSVDLSDPLVVWFNVTDIDINVLALLDVSGAVSISAQFFDTSHAAITGYDAVSSSLLEWDMAIPVSWYWWFFADINQSSQSLLYLNKPPSAVYLKVTINQAVDAVPIRVGTLAFGGAVEIGDTQFGATLGLLDFSKKVRDEVFGTFSVLERGYARTMSCDCVLSNSSVSSVYSLLASIRAVPVIWIGSAEATFNSTIVYGFYKSFNVVLESAGASMCNLEIEGLV